MARRSADELTRFNLLKANTAHLLDREARPWSAKNFKTVDPDTGKRYTVPYFNAMLRDRRRVYRKWVEWCNQPRHQDWSQHRKLVHYRLQVNEWYRKHGWAGQTVDGRPIPPGNSPWLVLNFYRDKWLLTPEGQDYLAQMRKHKRDKQAEYRKRQRSLRGLPPRAMTREEADLAELEREVGIR